MIGQTAGDVVEQGLDIKRLCIVRCQGQQERELTFPGCLSMGFADAGDQLGAQAVRRDMVRDLLDVQGGEGPHEEHRGSRILFLKPLEGLVRSGA